MTRGPLLVEGCPQGRTRRANAVRQHGAIMSAATLERPRLASSPPGTLCIRRDARTPLVVTRVHAFIWPFARAARGPCSGRASYARQLLGASAAGYRSTWVPITGALGDRPARVLLSVSKLEVAVKLDASPRTSRTEGVCLAPHDRAAVDAPQLQSPSR